MADFHDGTFEGPEGWTMVRVVNPPPSMSPQIREMREWLSDPIRPGSWLWWGEVDDLGNPALVVYLTDPAAAFEFKMRWA